MMPWQQHTLARHAWWAKEFVCVAHALSPAAQPPWVRLLVLHMQELHPHLLPHMLFAFMEPGLLPCGVGHTPVSPLRRLARGLLALPPLTDISDAPLVLGPWCFSCPLWGNPVLTAARAAAGLGTVPLERMFPGCGWLFYAKSMQTVGDAVRAAAALAAARLLPRPEFKRRVIALVVGVEGAGDMARMQYFWDADDVAIWIDNLVSALPPDWRQAAQQVVADGASAMAQCVSLRHVMEDTLLPRMGWRLPGLRPAAVGPPVAFVKLTVREGTRLQMGPVQAHRHRRRMAFVASALDEHVDVGATTGVVAAACDDLRKMLPPLWKLRWENMHKEVYWRMMLDGLPKYGGNCACGHTGQDREHVFWDCAVAQAVLTELRRAVPGLHALMREHVWLMRRPLPSLHEGVWRVVCLSAVSAMDLGHRVLHVLHSRGDVDGQEGLRRAGVRAVARFWELLQDFVGLQSAPAPSGGVELGPAHPFVGSRAGGQLVVNYPGVTVP
jgi:hypothetical protein